MLSDNLAFINCEGLARYLASLTYKEAQDVPFEIFRRKHAIERRFRVERRVRRGRPLWGNLRSGDRRRVVYYERKVFSSSG